MRRKDKNRDSEGSSDNENGSDYEAFKIKQDYKPAVSPNLNQSEFELDTRI